MRRSIVSLTLVTVLFVAVQAHGAFSVQPFVVGAAQDSGGTPFATGTSMVVPGELTHPIDANAAIFDGGNFGSTSFPEAQYALSVAGVGAADGQNPGFTFPTANSLQNGTDFVANDTLFTVLMFPVVFDPTVEGPGVGVEYAYLVTGPFPADGGGGGTWFDPDDHATTVPEPALGRSREQRVRVSAAAAP